MDSSAQGSGKNKSDAYVDWLGLGCPSECGIPRRCLCGGEIIEEVLEHVDHDTCPGRRYFLCKKYRKSDGTHIRQPWVYGVTEEIQRMERRLQEVERVVSGMSDLMTKMESLQKEVSDLKSVVADLNSSVELLETVCYE